MMQMYLDIGHILLERSLAGESIDEAVVEKTRVELQRLIQEPGLPLQPFVVQKEAKVEQIPRQLALALYAALGRAR